MADMSYLDKKYFIDPDVYNCPFCNRNNVLYKIVEKTSFDWTNSKKCFVYFVMCSSCKKKSMHLSYETFDNGLNPYDRPSTHFLSDADIDSKIFYSVPTTFFVLDDRIPRVLRELISEGEGCMKMNFLTGASACMRKTIYELLIIEEIKVGQYEDRIKSLKKKYPDSDPALYEILSHIQEMTSDKIHEQSWSKWDSKFLSLIIETLKTVLYNIYVLPQIKRERVLEIEKLRESVFGKKE